MMDSVSQSTTFRIIFFIVFASINSKVLSLRLSSPQTPPFKCRQVSSSSSSSSTRFSRREVLGGIVKSVSTTSALSITGLIEGSSCPAFAADTSSSSTPTTTSADYLVGPRGIKYKIMNLQNPASTRQPQRGQNVKTSFDLYVNGFPEWTTLGDLNPNTKSKLVDTSKTLLGSKDEYFTFTAGIGRVIKGWDLMILDMVEGERRRIIIPPGGLGYDNKAADLGIKPNSVFYLDVELVEIKPMAKLTEEQIKWLDEHPL